MFSVLWPVRNKIPIARVHPYYVGQYIVYMRSSYIRQNRPSVQWGNTTHIFIFVPWTSHILFPLFHPTLSVLIIYNLGLNSLDTLYKVMAALNPTHTA